MGLAALAGEAQRLNDGRREQGDRTGQSLSLKRSCIAEALNAAHTRHVRMVPSSLALANVRPPGENARDVTSPSWPA